MTQIEIFKQKFEKMVDNIPASVDSGAGYVIDEVYKILDSLNNTELPEDLEEAATRDSLDYVDSIPDGGTDKHPWNDHDVEKAYYDGMLAGAEWGMNQMPLSEDTTIFQKGVAEGKRLMMEGAVEGEIMTNGFYPYEPRVVAPFPNCPYNFGDKVKVIVIPE